MTHPGAGTIDAHPGIEDNPGAFIQNMRIIAGEFRLKPMQFIRPDAGGISPSVIRLRLAPRDAATIERDRPVAIDKDASVQQQMPMERAGP
jgi:hypothetical protein